MRRLVPAELVHRLDHALLIVILVVLPLAEVEAVEVRFKKLVVHRFRTAMPAESVGLAIISEQIQHVVQIMPIGIVTIQHTPAVPVYKLTQGRKSVPTIAALHLHGAVLAESVFRIGQFPVMLPMLMAMELPISR